MFLKIDVDGADRLFKLGGSHPLDQFSSPERMFLYEFVSVVSQERLIEARKLDYYRALNKSQASWKSKNEDISPWLLYFLGIIREQSQQALELLKSDDAEHLLSDKQLELWRWANQLPDRSFARKDAIEALEFPPRTIEASIKKLVELKKLTKAGEGRATRYRVKPHRGGSRSQSL